MPSDVKSIGGEAFLGWVDEFAASGFKISSEQKDLIVADCPQGPVIARWTGSVWEVESKIPAAKESASKAIQRAVLDAAKPAAQANPRGENILEKAPRFKTALEKSAGVA